MELGFQLEVLPTLRDTARASALLQKVILPDDSLRGDKAVHERRARVGAPGTV